MMIHRVGSRALRAFVVTTALAAGCGGAEEPTGAAGTTGGEASYQGAVASTDVALGQQVYEQQCAPCHTADAAEEGYGPAVAGIGWDPAAMRRQVREGEDRMPAFGEDKISADELEALLAYMVNIGAVAGTPVGSGIGGAP